MITRSFSLLALFFVASHLSISIAAEPAKGGSDVVDAKDILESLPRDLVKDIDAGSRNRVEAMDSASQKLRENFKDKTGSMSFTIRNVSKNNGRYSVFATAERIRVAGTQINCNYSIFFKETENEKVAKLKQGDKVNATGKIFASINGAKVPYLRIELGDATLK